MEVLLDNADAGMAYQVLETREEFLDDLQRPAPTDADDYRQPSVVDALRRTSERGVDSIHRFEAEVIVPPVG